MDALREKRDKHTESEGKGGVPWAFALKKAIADAR